MARFIAPASHVALRGGDEINGSLGGFLELGVGRHCIGLAYGDGGQTMRVHVRVRAAGVFSSQAMLPREEITQTALDILGIDTSGIGSGPVRFAGAEHWQ